MVPDYGSGLAIFFFVVVPLLFAIPMLATAITVAVVAKIIGQSMIWAFAGLFSALVAVIVFGGLAISTDTLGVGINGSNVLAAVLVWFLFTWGAASAVVLIPMWYINKNEPTL